MPEDVERIKSALLNDPDFQAFPGKTREESAWATAQNKINQMKKNAEVLSMVDADIEKQEWRPGTHSLHRKKFPNPKIAHKILTNMGAKWEPIKSLHSKDYESYTHPSYGKFQLNRKSNRVFHIGKMGDKMEKQAWKNPGLEEAALKRRIKPLSGQKIVKPEKIISVPKPLKKDTVTAHDKVKMPKPTKISKSTQLIMKMFGIKKQG